VEVHHLTDENPQEPEDHPDFWNIWVRSIRKFCPTGPDLVFSSEPYGDELARRLGAAHYAVDIARKTFPVSGTMIRNAPFRYWDYIPEKVRPYFVKKMVIYGPESTGKTTLARDLARHYNTLWVEEYARRMLDEKGIENGLKNTIELSDIDKIGRGQPAIEDESVKKADKLLFCDSDLITTVIYSRHFFNTCPAWVQAEADRRTYDLYLLADIDLPWEADPQRDTGDKREEYFQIFKHELDIRSRPYKILSGLENRRLQNAVRIVDEFIKPYYR
jgi:NadR type nicotinamide-nucleotide adenylyltransferase